jgi:hypothetical protein
VPVHLNVASADQSATSVPMTAASQQQTALANDGNGPGSTIASIATATMQAAGAGVGENNIRSSGNTAVTSAVATSTSTTTTTPATAAANSGSASTMWLDFIYAHLVSKLRGLHEGASLTPEAISAWARMMTNRYRRAVNNIPNNITPSAGAAAQFLVDNLEEDELQLTNMPLPLAVAGLSHPPPPDRTQQLLTQMENLTEVLMGVATKLTAFLEREESAPRSNSSTPVRRSTGNNTMSPLGRRTSTVSTDSASTSGTSGGGSRVMTEASHLVARQLAAAFQTTHVHGYSSGGAANDENQPAGQTEKGNEAASADCETNNNISRS